MLRYKIYSLDKVGHIVLAEDVECADDLDALARAEAAADRFAIEVWQDRRLVARVKIGNLPLDSSDPTLFRRRCVTMAGGFRQPFRAR